jgi:hypothetical protein
MTICRLMSNPDLEWAGGMAEACHWRSPEAAVKSPRSMQIRDWAASVGVALHHMLTQHAGGPLAETRTLGGFDAIPNGNDDVEVVVIDPAPPA